jgi:uncharacterized protein
VTLDDAAEIAERQEPWVRRAAWTVFALAFVAFLVRGADSPADPYVEGSAEDPAVDPASLPQPVAGFGSILVRITQAGGTFAEFCALLADDTESRQQGLMERTDLAGHEGMVFRFDEPVDSSFYMYRTVMPLSIAWFDEAGAYVTATQMEPCPSEDPAECPSYGTDGRPYLYALEVPRGTLGLLGAIEGSRIEFPEGRCR